MKLKNNFILLLFVMIIFQNTKAQTRVNIDSVFKKANKYFLPTACDTLFFNDFSPRSNNKAIIENWQDKNGFYFEGKEIDKICNEIAFAEVLRNKMAAYSPVDSIKPKDSYQISPRVIVDYLTKRKDGERTKSITGFYFESFNFGAKTFRLINRNIEMFKDKRTYKSLFKRSRCRFGFIQIDSNIEGCTIMLDGVDTEISTNKKLSIPVGHREIKVVKEGYTNCMKILNVKKRRQYELICVLEKL